MNKKIIGCILVIIFVVCGFSLFKLFSSNKSTKTDGTNVKEELKNNSINEEISDLDTFYNNSITKKYKDIRDLDANYSIEQAQKDNCFVIGATMVHNDYLYSEFMDNYKNNKSGFIRVVQFTVEGDIIILDIMFDSNSKKIIIVTDSTRDKFSSEEDRIIKLKKYENIAEYNYDNHLYWIAYNGELSDETFNNEDSFVIATIN